VHIVHTMTKKTSFGIRLEDQVAKKLDEIVKDMKDIRANRSEIDKTKELVMRKRKGELWVENL